MKRITRTKSMKNAKEIYKKMKMKNLMRKKLPKKSAKWSTTCNSILIFFWLLILLLLGDSRCSQGCKPNKIELGKTSKKVVRRLKKLQMLEIRGSIFTEILLLQAPALPMKLPSILG